MIAERLALAALSAGCLVAVSVWWRSCRRLRRACTRLERSVEDSDVDAEALVLARSTYLKALHTTLLYGMLAAAALTTVIVGAPALAYAFVIVLVPVGVSVLYAGRLRAADRIAEERTLLERRAEEVLAQEELAPMRWAARLAPADLPETPGFEVSQIYQPGVGAMAGDFYDLYQASATRLAVVIGDVSGHGIEPSITAFQVKYLSRVFLGQYRDPAQAVEELNSLLASSGRPEELVSLCAVVLDRAAGTLRFASAGHPAAWLWHRGEVRPLRATGPLLTLDPRASYTSRELPLEEGDVLLLYTDGLADARSGEQLFGEERIAAVLAREPGQDTDTLCKSVLEAARDFATEPLNDDIAILAVRRS
jgi:serine phosphatase RsbU (regulator of sigma subunit)